MAQILSSQICKFGVCHSEALNYHLGPINFKIIYFHENFSLMFPGFMLFDACIQWVINTLKMRTLDPDPRLGGWAQGWIQRGWSGMAALPFQTRVCCGSSNWDFKSPKQVRIHPLSSMLSSVSFPSLFLPAAAVFLSAPGVGEAPSFFRQAVWGARLS